MSKNLNLKVGDIIYYGDKDFSNKDVVEKNEKTKKFYGKYLKNGAPSEEFSTIKELLDSYLDYWENVKVVTDNKEIILKDFKRDLKELKENGYITLSKNLTRSIKIEILKIKVNTYEKERFYYLEFHNKKLAKYQRINI